MSVGRSIGRVSLNLLRQSPIVYGQHSNSAAKYSSLFRNSLLSPPASVRHLTGFRRPSPSFERPPLNWGVAIVPEHKVFVIERNQKYLKTLTPGIHFLLPLLDKIAYVHSLKVVPIQVPPQTVYHSGERISISTAGVLYLKVLDPMSASYTVGNAPKMILQLAIGAVCKQIRIMKIKETIEQDPINDKIATYVNNVINDWGFECVRYETMYISLPFRRRAAMVVEAAKRRMRARILESKGKMPTRIERAKATLLQVQATFTDSGTNVEKDLEYKENLGKKISA